MKRFRTIAIVASLLTLAAQSYAQVKSHTEIKTPALRKFAMPQPKRIALPNGMVIFLQEDHELPLIKGEAIIRGGSREMPAEKAGMASIYGQSWRTGGTASKTGDELDEILESRAARVETFGGGESTTVAMDALKQDFDTVFPIWLDVLKNPAFREDKIELAKTQARTGISRRNDEPGGILSRETVKLGYGADSPYARQAEYATINAITRDDLLAFHRKTVHPNNMIVSFIGDFDSAKVEKRLRDTFGSWPRGPQVTKPAGGVNPAKPGIYFVSKDDVTQANLSMVHPGIERNNPDYPAVQVMNEIFSGGFSGRLLQTLRSQRGLTYSVGGGIGANWDYPGLFRVSMATKSGTTLESIEALRGEVQRMINSPATADELSLAKESILNAFVFTMDTREKALRQQVLLEFYGFPADYFVKYPGLIEKVTAADVARVAKSYIHPDRLAVLVVGNEKDFEKPLSTLGTVTPIDITIPEADAGATKAAPAATNNEGLALANRVAEFFGGSAVLNGLQSLKRTAAMTMHTPQGAMEAQVTSIVRYADTSQRAVMTLPMGEMTRVVTPETAFMTMAGQTQDLPSSQRDTMVADLKSEPINVLRNIGNAKYMFSAGATEKVGGVDARVLDVTADGTTVKWYVEPSGRLIRTVSRASGPMPGDVVTDFSDWKAFSGLNLPTTSVVTRNGEKAAEIKLNTVELNPAIDANAFKKP